MSFDKKEAPFVHVTDEESLGRSYAPYGGVWADYHARERSIPARLKKLRRKLKKRSDQLDDWCDQSIWRYVLVLGLFGLAILASLGLYAHLFLL